MTDKQQQALDKKAENARELGLDYEPAPVQEPVAWMDADGDVYKSEPHKNWCPPHAPLYTTPPQRKPLTDKQILADETLRYYFGQNGGAGPVSKQGRKVVDAIEAAHGIKEKNT
jgi:hypothetical protein